MIHVQLARRLAMWVTLLLTLSTAVGAATKPADGDLKAAHFARGFSFTPHKDYSGTPLQTLLIPLDVYHTVAHRDLDDVRVFNATGALVPHAIRTRDTSTERPPRPSQELSYFPLRGAPERGVEAVEIRIQQDKATGNITVARTDVSATDIPIVGYLIALGDTPMNLHRLDLALQPTRDGFVTRVTLEASTNLESWRGVATSSLALLEYQGQRLERRSIDLSGRHHGYLRLSWGHISRPFEITAVSAVLEAAAQEPERHHLAVTITPDPKTANRYLFDLGGTIPIDRLSVTLPEINTLVHSHLQSAASLLGPWRGRYDGRLYRVSWQGEELSSPPIDVTVSRDRHWQLDIDPTGGGLGHGSPQVEVAWRPEQLVFVARGQGPFTVAYGNIDVARTPIDVSTLVAVVPGLRVSELPEQTGSMGEPDDLRGHAALEPPPKPVPWKQIILWAVLLLGVAVLGVMTLRLAKQLK